MIDYIIGCINSNILHSKGVSLRIVAYLSIHTLNDAEVLAVESCHILTGNLDAIAWHNHHLALYHNAIESHAVHICIEGSILWLDDGAAVKHEGQEAAD